MTDSLSWWLHLTNRTILHLHIVEGKNPMLVAWARRDRVDYYDLETGVSRGEKILSLPEDKHREGEAWQAFLKDLTIADNVYLPVTNVDGATIYTTADGHIHLYHTGAAELFYAEGGEETQLDPGEAERFVSISLDRLMGLVAAIDEKGQLHLYQQRKRVGAFDLGLDTENDMPLLVNISQGGGSVFISDGYSLLMTDSRGEVKKRVVTSYPVRQMTCAPEGQCIATCDIESGVIRIYDGSDLGLTHQRFAIDLVLEARQLQLIADLPSVFVAPVSLALDNTGKLAFSMSGVICATDFTHMNKLPGREALFDEPEKPKSEEAQSDAAPED